MINVTGNAPRKLINWFAKAGGVYKGQLVVTNSGATPASAALSTAIILGVALETQLVTNGIVKLYPVLGNILEIDYDPTATKKTFAVTDLGTQYDIVVIDNEHFLDPDDTTGGFLVLVGYENDIKKAYVAVEGADCFLSV